MIGLTQPPLVVGGPEFGLFMLANVVIFYFCFGKVWNDYKKWFGR